MPVNQSAYQEIIQELNSNNVTLVAVSKTKPVEDLLELYELGHREFGENYVQELVDKQQKLPQDVRWHFIGHLQTNKVKFIAPFIHLIQSVDSIKLLKEINKQAQKNNSTIDVLLQVHITQEETKFGLNEDELAELFNGLTAELMQVRIVGLMGMASLTDDQQQVRKEFKHLKMLFNKYASLPIVNCKLQTLSMGMSSDYKIAIEEGSNMVRIGSLLFGERI